MLRGVVMIVALPRHMMGMVLLARCVVGIEALPGGVMRLVALP